ncbi:MAG: ribosome maturation factor RimM [Gammaproteobacteria bacterium]|nr:ribosome maturation factor RimM [Gammaproteobacteria bacterium]
MSTASQQNDQTATATTKLVTLGRVNGVFGLEGHIKVFSDTEQPENIFKFSPWLLSKSGQTQSLNVLKGRKQGKGLVAKLAGIDNRDQAQALVGSDIQVARERLGNAEDKRYFWTDLEQLTVVNIAGSELGQVSEVMATGANDVLLAKSGEQERLIPFVMDDIVKSVDLERGVITVDWDEDY